MFCPFVPAKAGTQILFEDCWIPAYAGMNGVCGSTFDDSSGPLMIMSSLPTPEPWSLHPQLARDTIAIGDLALSRLLVVNDANWPWLLLVPRRAGASEIIDLDEVERAQLMTEIARVARALKEVTACGKLNVAALGNVVAQLHVHVIARRSGDAGWPKPIWGAAPPLAHDAGELERFVNAIKRKVWVATEGS
jgi:diadenosine tetraphosphate (Ap4A) HIT family hydrolase